MDDMNRFVGRALVLWFRLIGMTETQAEWRARRALQPRAAAPVQPTEGEPKRYFNCVCGQLMLAEYPKCPKCGRRNRIPYGARRAMRALGVVLPEAAPVTILLAVLIAVGYVAQIRFGASKSVFDPNTGRELVDLGAVWWPNVVIGGQWWRAVTYTMLHGGLWHIAFNAIALAQVGPLVEARFGSARVLFGWFATGVAAVLVPPLLGFARGHLIIGASGAVFGLIGMALMQGHRDGDARGRMMRDVMIHWVVYATLFGFMIGGVAHSAHFGGLAAGAALALALPPPDGIRWRRAISPYVAIAGPLIVAWGLYGFINTFWATMPE